MSTAPRNPQPPPPHAAPRQYVVVARRYRPQRFDELLGQERVAKSLVGAISSQRVGHAYLFTGARGVGKTSAARILAKALNCQHGPSPTPCNACDICRSISGGDDIDVLEIDGASNRGIDEIRQLRQNVNVRPSRARFKIYIIDEVHMLTREAFNALLKTLEEPPEHVKFIFCTTEPGKIPITIMSRCQRFDFAGISTAAIAGRLRQIVESEGLTADDVALETLARRAAGSMRDSQSLLEQLLACTSGRITLAEVHAMLGTAADEFLDALVGHLIAGDAAAALAALDAALTEGPDVGQLLEQLLGYFRDLMVAAAGGAPESLLYVGPSSRDAVAAAAKRLGLWTILAAIQILDHTLARLRFSTQGRVLAELALVEIGQLEGLDDLGALISGLQGGTSPALAGPQSQVAAGSGRSPAATAARAAAIPAQHPAADAAGKKNFVVPASSSSPAAAVANDDPPQPAGRLELTSAGAAEVWRAAVARLSGMVAESARQFDDVTLARPDQLVVAFKAANAFAKSLCQEPENLTRIEQALLKLTGRPVRLEFTVKAEESPKGPTAAAAAASSPQQRLAEIADYPLVHRAGELFGAQPIRVDDPVE